MNNSRSGLLWGSLLIGGGMLALARQLGYIDDFSPLVWVGIFAAVSLLALVNYISSSWTQWGWLFPAGVFSGLAVTAALASANIDNAAIASPLFFGLILPFAAAYLTDRSQNWWALIPGGVMTFLALTTLIVDSTANDEFIGALFLVMIAAIFLLLYLNNRARIWALIVAYAIAVLSIAPLMSMGGRDAEYFGPLFLFAIALPFFVVYFRSVENWWAIIPAGALTITSMVAALSISGIVPFEWEDAFMTALMMVGLALTFAMVWLRHDKPWAKIVTLLLAALAVLSFFFINYYQVLWPVVIILAGIYLFYTALRPKAV
jgi:hypothetical protein